jgi:hypothetical protein
LKIIYFGALFLFSFVAVVAAAVVVVLVLAVSLFSLLNSPVVNEVEITPWLEESVKGNCEGMLA